MTYLTIGIAIVVVGGVSYLIYRRYRKRVTQPSGVSEEEVSEIAPESSEAVSEVERAAPPVAPGISSEKTSAAVSEAGKAAPPVVSEISSLSEVDENKLMNAVWYRCENPYCNYTQFLDVHHIVSEVEGGSNKLDNLMVLCAVCHAAVHNHEISEEELQSWVRERTERFKSDLDWPYK